MEIVGGFWMEIAMNASRAEGEHKFYSNDRCYLGAIECVWSWSCVESHYSNCMCEDVEYKQDKKQGREICSKLLKPEMFENNQLQQFSKHINTTNIEMDLITESSNS